MRLVRTRLACALTSGSAPLIRPQFSSVSGVSKVACSLLHSVALKADGTVWTWGNNSEGELGDGTTTDRHLPVQVPGVTSAVAVAAGECLTVLLQSDGKVYTCGTNWLGQLGDGSTTTRGTPMEVPGLTGVTAISAGWAHVLVLKSDGTVWAWGNNSEGELGDGTTINRTSPVQVAGLTGITAIGSGDGHSFALKADGTVLAWGHNGLGALGDGTTTARGIPGSVNGFSSIVKLGAGATLGINNDGSLLAWGVGGEWLDATLNLTGPRTYLSPIAYTSAASSGTGVVACKNDGTVWEWGEIHSSTGYTAIRLIVHPGDTDQDGMLDIWEMQNFGSLARDGGQDDDGDGLTDIEEFFKGTNPLNPNSDGDLFTDFADQYPNDYYNAVSPTLAMIGGNSQTALPGEFNSQPFDVAIFNSMATEPLVNAPVVFTVQSGGGFLAASRSGSPATASTLVLRTDSVGTAQAFYRQPAAAGIVSSIAVSAGTATPLSFTTTSASAPTGDSDNDGLADAWEMTHFGNLNQSGSDDFDGDGVTNAQEFVNNTNPGDYYNGALPLISPIVGGDGRPGANGLVSVRVTKSDGTPLSNAPVTFAIGSGPAGIAPAPDGTSSAQLVVRANADGVCSGYVAFNSATSIDLTVTASSGSQTSQILLTLTPTLPLYTTGFEPTEGYVAGPLGIQELWTASDFGEVIVTTSAAASGVQSLSLGDGGTAYRDLYEISGDVLFADFWAKPVAEEESDRAFFELNYTRLALRKNSTGRGELWVNGNWEWVNTGVTFPLTTEAQTQQWIRFTVRRDVSRGRWDLFVNGTMVVANEYAYGSVYRLRLNGPTTGRSLIDNLSFYADNPLFVDVDNDAMEDSWERANGLDASLNDRDGDLDEDGLSNFAEMRLGTNPARADTDGDGFGDKWEVANGLDPTTAASAEVRNSDSDADGLTLEQEFVLGTSPTTADTDGDDIPDGWELAHHMDPRKHDSALDPDGDGRSNLDEYRSGTDFNDPYNGVVPVLTAISGDATSPIDADGRWAVKITAADGTALVNSPVLFKMTEGDALFATSPTSTMLYSSITVLTGPDGVAVVYVKGGQL